MATRVISAAEPGQEDVGSDTLTGIQRIVRGNAGRRTRFHTERGERLPISAWGDVPAAILKRVLGTREGPWMAPGAVRYLDAAIPPAASVLELGSGASTAWYAERAAHVLSLESEVRWLSEVARLLADRGLVNGQVRQVAIDDLPITISELEDGAYDLVVVDQLETPRTTRLDTTRVSATKVRPGGMLVLDDSDRERLHPVTGILAGWPVRRFLGIKPAPLMAVETSVFRRPTPADR